MTRFFIPLFLICFFSSLLSAQTDASSNVSARPERQASPRETMLKNEAAELSNYSYHLAQLKEAFAANNAGKMAVEESIVIMALRDEISQLNVKLAAETAQAERRKSASSGQLTQAANPEEVPARDPLADAVTPDEIRLEQMQYTLAAFERHAFDPSKPADAARDFAKLDKVEEMMRKALAELKKQ